MHAVARKLLKANTALTASWRTYAWSALALVIGLYALGWLSGIERVIKDTDALLMRHAVHSDVVLVDIDAKSLRQLNTWPWPRRYHAQLLDQLLIANPAVVAFDIDFSSESNPEDDGIFSQALSRWEKERVALVAFLQYSDSSKDSVIANYPIPILRKHVRIASINLFPSGDGLVRAVSLRDADHPPNAPPLAKFLQSKSDFQNDLLIDYSIDPNSIQHYSYVDIMEGRFEPRILEGKKIIVGATAIELRDQVAVPLYQVLPGPVVQALAYESLRSGAAVLLPRVASIGMIFVFGGIIIVLMIHIDVFPRLWEVLAGIVLIYAAALAVRWVGNYQLDAFPFMLFLMSSYVVRQIARIDRQVISSLAQKLLLKRKQYQIDTINNHTLEGIVTVDAAGQILSANHACCSILSRSLDELVGIPLSKFFPALAFEQGKATIHGMQSTEERFEIVGLRGSGEPLYADISIETSGHDGGVASMVFVRDISTLKLKQEMLDFQASHDSSTRLLNKTGFVCEIDAGIAGPSNIGSCALLVIGVRSMIAVNHELGHAAGEYLFKTISDSLIEMCARRGGMLLAARIATNEFGLWIKGNEDVARAYADDITRLVDEPLMVNEVQVDVRLAIGAAIYPKHAENASDILRHASVAMNDVDGSVMPIKIFNNDITAIASRKLTLASQLREAIANNGLSLYYQPKLNMRTNCITSVEALARWKHAELGYISPDEFIHIAEETGVIKQLTTWAFMTAVNQHMLWLQQGIDLRVAVNISSKLLSGDALLGILDKATAVHPALTSALVLEITESAVMDNRQDALELLNSLSCRGYRLSLDDFGTGQSSFAYLKDLPVQELKIDKSFVVGMDKQPKDAQIVSSIIALAHGLGLEVVAEGIESQVILDLLRSQGCEYGQGFLIGKPVPAEELTARLIMPSDSVQSVR